LRKYRKDKLDKIINCQNYYICFLPVSIGSESSPVITTEHHNSFVNGLAEMVTNFKARALLLEDEQESLLATLMNLREECDGPSPSIAG
jgi:hypothetical protein